MSHPLPYDISSSGTSPATKQASEPGFVSLDNCGRLNGWEVGRISAERPIVDLILGNERESIPGAEVTSCSSIDGLLEQLDKYANMNGLTAIGYIGYEATLPLLGLKAPETLETPLDAIPPARFLIYEGNSTSSKSAAVSEWEAEGKAELITAPSRSDYETQVRRVKKHIAEGDIYQANYTTRFKIASERPPSKVYDSLLKQNPASHSAYLDFGDYQIVSSSPERMFLRNGSRIMASPIKGTIWRGSNEIETAEHTKRLLASEKDRAELLMIVDLYRNDLGKIARTGSVRVENLFRAELHPSLIHLVSDISAELQSGIPHSEIIRALLPGGSITGAPKRRAVEILGGMETTRRNVYTGCIGYIRGEQAEFSIAIRTLTHAEGLYHIHAGGGIVADSDPEAEFYEMQLKAHKLLEAVGLDTGVGRQ